VPGSSPKNELRTSKIESANLAFLGDNQQPESGEHPERQRKRDDRQERRLTEREERQKTGRGRRGQASGGLYDSENKMPEPVGQGTGA
jgi:hypothetical protein